jgi:hypothetical protein
VDLPMVRKTGSPDKSRKDYEHPHRAKHEPPCRIFVFVPECSVACYEGNREDEAPSSWLVSSSMRSSRNRCT